MKSRLLGLIESQLAKQRQSVLESMGEGGCPDYSWYRYQCGYLRGLDVAVTLIQDLEKGEE